jgi:hypothetical protein
LPDPERSGLRKGYPQARRQEPTRAAIVCEGNDAAAKSPENLNVAYSLFIRHLATASFIYMGESQLHGTA